MKTDGEASSILGLKAHPNRARYIKTLRAMTPDRRLRKAIELAETARALLRDGLRARFPELSEAERRRIFLARLRRWDRPTS